MAAFSHQTQNRFAVEGLESRILLSAVPMDAMMEVEAEPAFYEMQYLAEAASGESEDVLWEGASVLLTEEDAYALTISSAGVFDASGQLLQAVTPGMELVADTIHIAGGTLLDAVSLQANSIVLDEVAWTGASHLDAAEIQINGAQTALPGASLYLTPSAEEAPIFLGQPVDGVLFGVDKQELTFLSQAGFANLTIGSVNGSHQVTIDGLEYHGNLTLQAPVEGGSFRVLGMIVHSGGTLTYLGTGNTQFTSADTLTEGVPVVINDTVELVYNVDNNNIIRIDTTDGDNDQGADISITGNLRGSGEGGGGTLILNAGTHGTILIGGNIGTSKALQKIIIENAAEVIIEGNILVQEFEILNGRGDVILGTSNSNFVNIEGLGGNTGVLTIRTANNITINGDLEMVNGDATFEITGNSGSRQLWIKGEVGIDDGDLVIERASRVLMSDDVYVAGTLSQAIGLDYTRFDKNVTAADIELRADNQIRFAENVLLLSGDLALTTNNIDFNGGSNTVIGALNASNQAISNAYFRPISPAGEMNIGTPVGAGTNFTFSATDIAALANGWSLITFGYDSGATNLARIGSATFLDAVAIYAGSMLVNGPLAARTGLTMNAATADMSFTNAAFVSVVNEQIDNIWQPSFINLTAQQGDILFNNGALTAISNTANPITGTPASTITMTATLGEIRDLSATPGFQEARDMHLSAAGDILLYTNIQNIWVESTNEGDVTIFELDGLHVHSAITANGAILIDTGGLTRVDLASSITDHADNTITVAALGSLLVGEILAGNQGDVSLTAEDAIVRIPGLADPDHRIVADQLTLLAETGIGEIAAPLLIRSNGLDAENLTEGHVRITHDGQRDELTVRIINRSNETGDLLSLDVLDADVTVLGVENHADGGVYLEVIGALVVSGAIVSDGGAVNVSATAAAEMTPASSIRSNGGDVVLVAEDQLLMAVDARVISIAGNVAIESQGNILLGVVDARDDQVDPGVQTLWGSVTVLAGGWLRDHADSELVNIYANELQLSAQTGIGELPVGAVEHTLEIEVRLLAAAVGSSGDIALHGIDDLITGVAQQIEFDSVDKNGDVAIETLPIAPLAGILNSGGGSILLSAVGTLTLRSNELAVDSSAVATSGLGNVVLVADALTIEDAVLSNGGAISADVVNAINLAAGVTVATNGAGTIAFRSSAGSISAAADTLFSTEATAIVLSAANNLTLGAVSAPGGEVGLIATTGALRSAADGVDDRTVVTADTLTIVAGGEVNGPSGSAEPLRISVNTLSLMGTSGSVYRLLNDQSLTIDTTSASAELFDSLMVASDLEVAAQSDFTVSGVGNIELIVEGDLTLASGRVIDTTDTGNIALTIDGTLAMGTLSLIENAHGAINILAGGTIAVARIASVDGAIAIESQTGAIIDSDPDQTAVVDFATAGQLTLIAATGIGIEDGDRDTLTVELGTLNASTVDGGIFIASAGSFTLNGIATTGTTVPVLITSGGLLTVENTVIATGDVVLRAGDDFIQELNSEIIAGADIALSAGGAMTLYRVETPTAVALEVASLLMGYPNPTVAAIEAAALLLNSVGAVAAPEQPLFSQVGRLAGNISDGALALQNQGNLTIGAVTVETIPVGTADSLPLAPRVQFADRLLIAGTGSGVFMEVDGVFATETATDASLETVAALPVLVQSAAEQIWNGRFSLGGGAVTLRAGDAVTLDASNTFNTTDGSLLIEADGQVAIGNNSVLNRGAGDLIIDAIDNIIIAGQIVGTGHAALLSGDAILVGADNFVQATDLILRSAQGIASINQALVTEVDRLAIRTSAGGVFLENAGDLVIANLGFSLLSLLPGAFENAAFSGFVGGVVAAQGGAIVIDNDGAVTVDPIGATINALPNTSLAFSLLANDTGSAGNGVGVFIVRDDPEIAPLTAVYGEEDRSLVIYIQNGVNTLAEILDIINNHPDFPATAVLAGGRADGSTVFNLPALISSAFVTTGGSEDGMRTEVAGALANGAEPIAASSQLLVPDNFFTIRITSDEPGAAINNVTVRLLNEGPLEVADGGRLNPGTNAAIIEWDGSEFLDIYVNFGFTTVGTVINRINEQLDIPFSAQLGGTFTSSSLNVALGDEPVLMESNLRASAILRPIGSNNDFEVIATSSGPLFNGITFIFLDDGTIPDNGAQASFNPVTNVMTIRVQSGITTGNQVIAALNAQGTFTAALAPELDSVNTGTGAIQAQRFLTAGGAVAVQATAVLQMVGSNNDVTLTAIDEGDDFNNIEIRFVANTNASPGSVAVNYNSDLKRLTLTVNPLFTSAAQVVDAVNAATTPFTATSNGSGTFALAQYPLTSGGTGAAARAEFIAAGDNNDFQIVANSDSTAFINTRVFLIDDGSISNGSATATYLSEPRHLIIKLQSGVTTANTVLAAINDAAIPMTATLLSDNNGSGVYHIESAVFAGGVNPISATSTVVLPSGAQVSVVADEGGVAANGIQIAFAIDASLPADSAAVSWFELGGKRILQLRIDSATTELSLIAAALTADETIPFSLSGDLSSAAGDLAPMTGNFNEGTIALNAAGDIRLIGRIDSQTGRVLLTTTNSDLIFDSASARIEAIDGVALDISGSFANLASLEAPLIRVYGEALLSLTTGNQDLVSTESVYFLSGGDIFITGAGFAVRDGFDREQFVRLEASNDLVVDAAIRTVAAVVNADGIVFTVVKSAVDGNDQPLSEATPVAIEVDGGNYTIYALPGVATHADIVNAINAIEINDLTAFFATLGRQDGTLVVGAHTFFITSLTDAVIQNVTIAFANLVNASVQANFVGTTLTLLLDSADDATVADVLLAINNLSAFSATTSTIDTTNLLRGAAARDFDGDYLIEIVADAEQQATAVLNETDATFTLSAVPGVATRLDLLNALTASGLFAGSVPQLDARLEIGDFTFFLNTGAALNSVNLTVGFVAEGTLAVAFNEGTGVLDITLNNVDAASGQDLRDALEALDFIVFSLATDLSGAIDTETAVADLQIIPAGTRTAPLSLDSPISVTLPVGSVGVFADVLFEVEGMLIALNWLVPVVGSTYTITTFADSLSSAIVDDANSPAATVGFGATGVFASTVLSLDGVNIAIAARSASLTLIAGNDVSITASGLLGGGSVAVNAGNALTVAGTVESGNIDLLAVDSIAQSGTIEATGTGPINVISREGAIVMSGAASTSSVSGPIFYQAAGNIAITAIASSGAARIDLISGAAITDALANDNLNLASSGFIALTAQAGIGAVGAGAINTLSGTIQLRNFGSSGDIVIAEMAAGGTLTATELTQNAVNGWSILSAAQGDVIFTGPVLHLSDGSLRVQANDSIITESGAPVVLNGGLLTFLAGDSIALNADIETANGDAWLATASGSLDMLAGITLNTGSGNVLLLADSDVTLAQVLTSGDIRVESTNGSILRAVLNDRTNLIASTLQLYAGVAVGSLASSEGALITDVSLLNATAASGVLAIRERNDLTIGSSAVSVIFAEAARSSDSVDFSASQWAQSGAGDAVLRVGGALVVEAIPVVPTLSVAGNLHINAANSVTVEGAVTVADGSLQWIAGDSFTLNADLNVTGGTLLLQATGDFIQDADAVVTVNDANAVIQSGGAMTVAAIDLGSGELALTASGNLTQHSDQLIEAAQVRLSSGGSIGTAADPFTFDGDRISAVAGGAMFLASANSLLVDTVEAIEVNTITVLGAIGPVHTVAAQSDLTTTANNGSIVLVLANGDLTLNGGLAGSAENQVVSAHGSGNILLQAEGGLTANADVRSGSGHISILANNDVIFNASADVLTASTASIYVAADSGAITMDDNSRFVTGSGDVALFAAQDITLGGISTTGSAALISATGSIFDGGDAYRDVIANGLMLNAAGSVGTSANALDISATTVTARAADGGIFLNESNGLTVGDVSINYQRVGQDALPNAVAVAAQSDLITLGGNGSILVQLAAGNLVLNDGTTPANGTAVSAHGSGNILLQTLSGSFTANADVVSNGGHVTLRSTAAMSLAADVSITTAGTGSLTLISSNSTITQNAGGTLTATDGDIILDASGNISIAGITTSANVAVVSISGSIIDNEAARVNIEADALLLRAGAAIGSGSNPIETAVNGVSAVALGGGVFLSELNAIEVTTTSAQTSVVLMDNTTDLKSIDPQSGLSSASSGAVVLVNAAGDITVAAENTVTAAANGHILLHAAANLIVNAAISSDAGNITLRSGNNFTLAAGINVSTGINGQISTIAFGQIIGGVNSRFINETGSVVLRGFGNITLGGIQSAGLVLVASNFGSIFAAGSDAFVREVIGSQLILSAVNGSVGTAAPGQTLRTQVSRVSAQSRDGVYLTNAAALRVDATSVSYRTVKADGTLNDEVVFSRSGVITATAADREIRLTVESQSLTLGSLSAHSVYVNVVAGSIVDGAYSTTQIAATNAELIAGSAIGAAGDGKLDTQIDNLAASAGTSLFLSNNRALTITTVGSTNGVTATNASLIEANGAIALNQAFTATNGNGLLNALFGDLSLNAGVTAGSNLSLLASGSVLQAANVSAGGTLDIQAAAGSFSMSDGVTATAVGNARVIADTSILLGGLSAANARLEAGTWIDTAGSSHVDLTASAVQLIAGSFIGQAQGTANGPLQTSINSLAASAATGSLYLNNNKALDVATVPAINVNRVLMNNTAPVQTGVETAGINADLFVKVVANGNLTLNAAVEAENDDLLLQALAGNLALNAAVTAGGSASLLASGAISLNAVAVVNVDGSLDIQAANGAITMTDGATTTATDNLRMLASGDIRLAGIAAANAYLNAGGAIIDNGNADSDIVANQLQLLAGGAIGEPAGTNFGLLDITVNTLAVQSGGGVFIDNSGSLGVASIAPINVARIGLDSSSTTQTGVTLSGIVAAGAVLLTTGDALTINQAITSSAATNILLEARDDAADLSISAAVSTVGGNISLLAGRSLTLSGNANVTVTAAPGTIDLQARTGSIDQASELTIQSSNANILLQAAVDVRLGMINAGSGSVGIIATAGSILDNKARTANTPNNITADALSMVAGGDIGRVGAGVDNAIETQVSRLSATTTVDGSIHIREFDTLLVDSVVAFSVNRVATSNLTDTTASSMEARSDVRSAGNGHVILRSVGAMTLNGGLAGANATTAVAAAGTGNVLIEVLAINADIFANAQVLADSGNISLISGRAIALAGTANIIVANGNGTIELNAARGNITQAASLGAETAGGNILFRARDNIQFGVIDARSEGIPSTWGLVGMIASTGSITDAKARSATAVNIFAAAANLTAAGHIGLLGAGVDNAIETDVGTLAIATTSEGSINIRQSSALNIDTVATFTANRVAADATIGTANTTVAARSDLRTAGNGAIVLSVNSGDLTLNAAAAAVVAADIRLQTLSGSIFVNADILSGSGHITLNASAAIALNDGVSIATGASGNVAISALAGSLTMADSAVVSTATGVARLSAAGDITLASVSANAVSLITTTGGITSSLIAGINVTAQNLRISASGSVGALANHIATAVDNLSALSSLGSIYITEANGVIVRDVSVSVLIVNANGTTATVTDAAQSDLTTGANGDIVLVATLGNIVLTDGTDNNGIAVNANGSGSIIIAAIAGELSVGSAILSDSGTIDLTATHIVFGAAISSDAEVSLVATDGGIVGTNSAALIDVGTNALMLNTTHGIGNTGSGAIAVVASALSIVNTVEGNVYVNLLSAATIEGIYMAGRGDLYLNQLDHDMQINGAIDLENGRMVLQTRHALFVNADLDAGMDIRLTGASLAVAAEVALTADGDILLRAQNSIAFAIGSSVNAGKSLTIFAGTDIHAATLTAVNRMDLRAGGSILRVDGSIEAPFMRLVASAGSLGAAGNELLLAAGRLDVSSASGLHLIQEGDVTIGRAGLVSNAAIGETISLAVQSGMLTSSQGQMRVVGAGTLLLDIGGELVLGVAVVAADGNITINTDKLSLTESASGVILQAANGRVTITSVSGIGAASGPAAEVTIAADELTATTDSGSINLVLTQTTRIVGDGVQINTGAGTLTMVVNTGSLTVDAPIRQMGSGAIDLAIHSGNLWINDIIRQNSGGNLTARVHNGHLTMGTNGRVQTTSGAMNLRASSDIWLYRVESTSGQITIRSDNESVRRLAGLSTSFPNIISATRPVVQMAKVAQFTVDSNSVEVNGQLRFRSGTYILISE